MATIAMGQGRASEAGLFPDLLAAAAALGAVAVGAALVELAIVPGVVIGGVAILAPRYLAGAAHRQRRARPVAKANPGAAKAEPSRNALALRTALPRLRLTQAVAKTITFRIIATTLDFSVNYVVLGNVAVAAGLSGFAFVMGPLSYLMHETIWNYAQPPDERPKDSPAWKVRIPRLVGEGADHEIEISRAIAKTITFRAIGTVMDFTTNYIVVGDLGTAVLLTSSGFILGPFVYFGHEKAWQVWGARWIPDVV